MRKLGFSATVLDIRKRKLIRWKVVDDVECGKFGITRLTPNNNGYIKINLSEIPDGLTVEETIACAINKGSLVYFPYRKLRRRGNRAK